MKTIYFDNAATSWPKPPCVSRAVVHYMTEIGCNVSRGAYQEAWQAEEVLLETRELLCELFHGDDARNVVFTPNVTAALNILLKGFLRPGDHVLVSSMEHNAVMRPLTQLASAGVTYTRIPCFPGGKIRTEVLEELLQPETKLLVAAHGSNVNGILQPLQELGSFCRAHGLLFFVDAAQTAGFCPVDMKKDCIDALAFTGHKALLGPQGTGGFLLREGLASRIVPLISGGTGSISHTEDVPLFMPDRFEAGTLNLPGLFGLHAALLWLRERGIASVAAHETALAERFLQELREMNTIQIIGHPADSGNAYAPVVSIQVTGRDLAETACALDEQMHIMTRVGLHCAPAAHKTLGTWPEGSIRFSFGHANTAEEVDICLDFLRKNCQQS